MDNEILKYLSTSIPITKELEEEINKIEFVKRFSKGTIIFDERKNEYPSGYLTTYLCSQNKFAYLNFSRAYKQLCSSSCRAHTRDKKHCADSAIFGCNNI